MGDKSAMSDMTETPSTFEALQTISQVITNKQLQKYLGEDQLFLSRSLAAIREAKKLEYSKTDRDIWNIINKEVAN
jgi:hypothetical protein